MTSHGTPHCRRVWVALTVCVVAGIAAGVHRPKIPPRAQPAPSAQHPVGHATATASAASTPRAGEAATIPSTLAPRSASPRARKMAYCVPLAAAYKTRPSSGMPSSLDPDRKFGRLLKPATAAALAAGRTDVAAVLRVLAQINSDPAHATPDQFQTALSGIRRVAPVIYKGCRINVR